MTKDLISPTGETIRIERSNNMKKITTENRTSLREESIRKERSNHRRSQITKRRNNKKKLLPQNGLLSVRRETTNIER